MKDATFGAMVKAAMGAGSPVSGVQGTLGKGGNFKLPLDKLAVIDSEAVSGRERVIDGVDWLTGDSGESPIMSRLAIVPTSQTRGRLASGQALPQTSIQAESGSAALGRGGAFPTNPAPVLGDLWRFNADVTGINALDEDGTAITEAARDETFRYTGAAWQRTAAVFGEHDYQLDAVIETKSEVSTQLALQSEFAMDAVLEAHRIAIADRLLEQTLSGDGQGRNLAGVAGVSGIGGATYVQADRGNDGAFTVGELAVEDGGGRLPFMAWALGKDISTSARTVAIEPGASRRVEERGRLTLSGTPTQRITEGLVATTALLADWRDDHSTHPERASRGCGHGHESG